MAKIAATEHSSGAQAHPLVHTTHPPAHSVHAGRCW
jgi:hypothetical protein